jgi:uncharacterized membrane protein YbaN (DUF454 family)
MTRLFVRIARIALGVTCLGIGVVGLFLPFIQGILLLVIGLTLLSTESERARRWLDWIRAHLHRKQPQAELGEQRDGHE